MPWKNIDRYTFTQVESLPHQLVVPQSEETEFDAVLADSSRWNPESRSAWIGEHRVDAKMEDGKYRFALPPLQSPTDVRVRVGDVLENMRMEPNPRPELSTLAASIELPDYLRRTEPVRREIRGGGMSVVLGSAVSIEAQATRPLQSATVDGQSIDVEGDWIRTRSTLLAETQTIEMMWVDRMGLTAKSPLRLKLRNVLDEAPSVVCRQLQQQSVMMEKEELIPVTLLMAPMLRGCPEKWSIEKNRREYFYLRNRRPKTILWESKRNVPRLSVTAIVVRVTLIASAPR